MGRRRWVIRPRPEARFLPEPEIAKEVRIGECKSCGVPLVEEWWDPYEFFNGHPPGRFRGKKRIKVWRCPECECKWIRDPWEWEREELRRLRRLPPEEREKELLRMPEETARAIRTTLEAEERGDVERKYERFLSLLEGEERERALEALRKLEERRG